MKDNIGLLKALQTLHEYGINLNLLLLDKGNSQVGSRAVKENKRIHSDIAAMNSSRAAKDNKGSHFDIDKKFANLSTDSALALSILLKQLGFQTSLPGNEEKNLGFF